MALRMLATAEPRPNAPRRRRTGWVSLLLAACLVAGSASAIEALEGRVQAHGFYELQLRALNADYSEQWDVAQWYNVFDLELEADIVRDPIGIIDTINGFARIEVRYDCVYSNGCGMYRNIDTYGNDAVRTQLPQRLSNAEVNEYSGIIPIETEPRSVTAMRVVERDVQLPDDSIQTIQLLLAPERRRGLVDLYQTEGFSTLAAQGDSDGLIGPPDDPPLVDPSDPNPCFVRYGEGTCHFLAGSSRSPVKNPDDPFAYVFERFLDYHFTQIQAIGGTENGLPVSRLGPWLPKEFVRGNATLADRVNPFDNARQSPVLRAAIFNTRFIDGVADAEAMKGSPLTNLELEMLAEEIDADVRAGVRGEPDRSTARGSGALGFRPIPVEVQGDNGANTSTPRGLFLPSAALRRELDSGKLADPLFINLREAERAWNRGSSQQDEKELKEAYLDIDLFEGRLWLRLGKQNIVWGKTELFRTTDQFNPQDLALASLPSLEESRIALWAVRGVWSFYDVGPLQDVRLEAAFNFDQYELDDFGACGEAYTVNLVCQATFGFWAHGTTAIGVAGIELPPSPWEDIKGLEVGARLEFRWDRFSFALSDFWGYPDIPFPDRLSTYERNVDPRTGRPRISGARGRCLDGSQADCLRPGPQVARTISSDPSDPNNPAKQIPNPDFDLPSTVARTRVDTNGDGIFEVGPPEDRDSDGNPDVYPDGFGSLTQRQRLADPNNALYNHPANQQIFAMVCSTTVGVLSLDRTACAQNAFGSPAIDNIIGLFAVSQLIGGALAGSPFANGFLSQAPDTVTGQATGVQLPLVMLHHGATDATDNGGVPCKDLSFYNNPGNPFKVAQNPGDQRFDCGAGGGGYFAQNNQALGQALSAAQESLLGCGPFWGTNCDDSGIDLLNAEGSALVQAFAGSSTFQDLRGFRTDDAAFDQPGTVGFDGNAAVCTFGNLLRNRDRASGRDANGKRLSARKLPGCRGPTDTGFANPIWNYDPAVDGDPTQVVSLAPPGCTACLRPGPNGHPFTGQPWQSEMAALSWNFQMLVVFQDDAFLRNLRKGGTPYDAGVCSFVTPQLCPNVQGLLRLMGVERPVVQAGGNAGFGRRDFEWQAGGEVVLRFEKRNVLGAAMDFAEDVSKANFSFEFTWIPNVPMTDNADWRDGIKRADQYNLTVSIDRPTFINFLNPNRTFFFNTQWFIQYVDGYESSFPSNGPWNVLATLAITTGYFQDRMQPSLVFVYDFMSVSGAALPQLTYRYNENFSITVGLAMFMGRQQLVDMPTNPIGGAQNRTGPHAFKDPVENGLSPIRDRDEVFLRLRYTF
jgi:hypothetical protein